MGREMKQLHKRKTKWACSACLVLVSTLCTTQFARAATWTGNGDGTSWNDEYNWDGYPSDGSDVMLGPYNANVIYDQNSTTKNISNLTLDWIFGHTEEYINTFQIVQNSGTLTISHIDDTFGDLNVEDGTLTINNGDMYASISTASTYTLNGGTLIKSGYEVKIGTYGGGLFVQNGGEFQFSGAMYLGDQVWSHGLYVMSNGSLVAGPNGLGSIVLGEWGGTGYFFHSGGRVEIADLTLARQGWNSPSGYYSLSETNHAGAPSTLSVRDAEYIGIGGAGEFSHTGGQHTVGKLVVGSSTFPEYQFGNWQYTKGYGTYTLNIQNSSNYNNELDVQSDLIIGDGGIGEFYHKSGNVKIGGNLVVGQNGATDAFTDSNGTHTSDSINGDGTYNLSNGTLQVVGSVYVGKDTGSKGTFTQTGGTATVNGTMTIAAGSEASLSDGTLTAGNLNNNGTLNLFKDDLLTVGDTFTNNGTLFLDLDNYEGGSFITLTNSTAVLNGTLQIDWHGTAQETTFTLLSAAHGFAQGSDLVFAFLNLPTVQNFHWEYTYNTNNVLLSLKSGASPVPVPSTMVLLGSALTALAGCRRRRATTH